jgi:hypothetical protein
LEVIAGILHDSYTNENGKEIPFEEKVVGVLEDDTFKCTSIPEFTTYDMPKEEFYAKVTDMQTIWSKE